MAKNIRGFFENLFEYYFLNIVVNVDFFSYLNVTVSTTLKYYHKQALNKKLKLMGGAMKYLALWSLGVRHFFKKFVKPSGPSS